MKKILTSAALAGLLLTNAIAADTKTTNVSKNAVIKAEQKAESTQLIKEAIRAIQFTQDALIYLNNNKTNKAVESLKKAVGGTCSCFKFTECSVSFTCRRSNRSISIRRRCKKNQIFNSSG